MINLLQTKHMKKSPKNLQRKNKEAVGKRKWSRLLASAANGLHVAELTQVLMSLWRVCVEGGAGEEKGKSSSSLRKLGLVSNTSMLSRHGASTEISSCTGYRWLRPGREWARAAAFF